MSSSTSGQQAEKYILTVVGEDRPGLTSALSAAIFETGGNWLEGHLSHLGGKFVGAIVAALPPGRLPDLKARLASDTRELRVDIHPVSDGAPMGEAVTLNVTSADRPGIVHELSQVLARLGANIVELETSAEEGAWQGSPIFRAHAALMLPQGLSHSTLQDALEGLSGDLMVEWDAP